MKGINVIKKFNLFSSACLIMLMLGSYTGLAQSTSDQINEQVIADMMSGEQVDINRADAETIAMVLDGVGLTKAEAIVDYRESNGDFKTVDDLLLVSGIGEVTVRNNAGKILLSSD